MQIWYFLFYIRWNAQISQQNGSETYMDLEN